MKGRHIERLPLEESEFDGAEAVHEVEFDDVARVLDEALTQSGIDL